MKQLRKQTKSEVLVNLFDRVGSKVGMQEVLDKTGIKNYNSLKAFFCYIRTAKHIPENNRMDIRISGNICERVR